ncbi:MAG: CYTH domain-containing protein [Clostridiales bacterium]|nr:CYTH domain-containing protein [Clostridiales bacterium]
MLEKDIQIKIKVNNFQKMKKFLMSKGAIFLGGWKEKTIRFDTNDKILEKKETYLRVKTGHENVVTLKEADNNNRKKFFESNNRMFQIDDIDSFCYIIKQIGFTKEYIMEKYRLAWSYKNIEFYIDELPFGIFIELKGEKEEINKMIKFLRVNQEELIKDTYWEIYANSEQNQIKSENIIFDKKHIFKIATI